MKKSAMTWSSFYINDILQFSGTRIKQVNNMPELLKPILFPLMLPIVSDNKLLRGISALFWVSSWAAVVALIDPRILPLSQDALILIVLSPLFFSYLLLLPLQLSSIDKNGVGFGFRVRQIIFLSALCLAGVAAAGLILQNLGISFIGGGGITHYFSHNLLIAIATLPLWLQFAHLQSQSLYQSLRKSIGQFVMSQTDNAREESDCSGLLNKLWVVALGIIYFLVAYLLIYPSGKNFSETAWISLVALSGPLVYILFRGLGESWSQSSSYSSFSLLEGYDHLNSPSQPAQKKNPYQQVSDCSFFSLRESVLHKDFPPVSNLDASSDSSNSK